MKKINAYFLLIVLPLFIQAQPTDSSYKHLSLKTYNYKLNGKRISNATFKSEIFKVPEAIPFYKRSKTQLWLGIALFTPGIIMTQEAQRRNPQRTNSAQNRLLASGGALICSGIYLAIKRYSNHKKAIKAYNAKKLPI
jgi:hypothetical protein